MYKVAQKGASLIEFMVASTLGIIAMTIIGSVFLSVQNVAIQRTKELSLLQATNSVLQMMKLDMHRAGYNGNALNAAKLSGAEHSYYIENSPSSGLIAYAYLASAPGASALYTNVVYQQSSSATNIVRICEKTQPTLMSVLDAKDFSGRVGLNCNTLFHKERIDVERFDVSLIHLSGSDASSAMVKVALQTSLSNESQLVKSLSFMTKQRNW